MYSVDRLLYVLDQIHTLACNAPAPDPAVIRWAEAGLNGWTGPGEPADARGELPPDAARVDPFPVFEMTDES